MIKREDLKKGDKILIVPNSLYTRDTTIYDAQVVGIGPKFITVAHIWPDGSVCQRTDKYKNDERMSLKDFGHSQLFLGTREEYQQAKELDKKTSDLVREISHEISVSLGYEKLKLIKDIIDSTDDVELYAVITKKYKDMQNTMFADIKTNQSPAL